MSNIPSKNWRIQCKKDSYTNWLRQGSKILLDGEIAFIEEQANTALTRLVVGNGTSSISTLTAGESRYENAPTDPFQRSNNYSVFYSGIGAGYQLPIATSTKLGGIRVDSSMFWIENEALKLMDFQKITEAGKGKVIHLRDVNFEIDNTLYANTIRTSEHYKQIDKLIKLNADLTYHITSLRNRYWNFYDQINALNLVNETLVAIPFTVEIINLEAEGDEEVVTTFNYDSIIIENNKIFFRLSTSEELPLEVYNSYGWVDPQYQRIKFEDVNNTGYSNEDYVARLLLMGYPDSLASDASAPLPLTEDGLYGGTVVCNWDYEDEDGEKIGKHAFIGMRYDDVLDNCFPAFSRDFNLNTPKASQDCGYLLYSTNNLFNGSNKNCFLTTDSTGKTIIAQDTVDLFANILREGNKISISPSGNKITVAHATIKTEKNTTSNNTYISSITTDSCGHVTEITSDNTTIKNLEDQLSKLAGDYSNLLTKYDELLAQYDALEERVSALEPEEEGTGTETEITE